MIFNTDAFIIYFSEVIHQYTKPKCAQCRAPYFCCSKHYCEEAQKYALKEYNIDISSLRTDHPKLPFMSNNINKENRCLVPPHLKPICTLHLCEEQHDEKYFRLRNILSYLLYRRGRDNPESSIVFVALDDVEEVSLKVRRGINI